MVAASQTGSLLRRAWCSNVWRTATAHAISFLTLVGCVNASITRSYQVEAVHGFLTNPSADLPPASYYNASGRGYPDITAFATNYPIIINGSWWQIGGTLRTTGSALIMLWH